MISKNFRLKEEEVKKVLKFWKPFFSYWMVLNYKNNKLENNRFAIIISGKNVDGSVVRNYFRRRFYDAIGKILKCESLLGCHPELDSGSLKRMNTFNDSVINTEWQILKNSQWQKPSPHYDFVFILKKQTKLDKTKIESINWYDNDIRFLLKAIDRIKMKD